MNLYLSSLFNWRGQVGSVFASDLGQNWNPNDTFKILSTKTQVILEFSLDNIERDSENDVEVWHFSTPNGKTSVVVFND